MPIMVRMIPIAECFYKERNNPPFKDSPIWPYFRKRKTYLLDGVFHAKTLFSSGNLHFWGQYQGQHKDCKYDCCDSHRQVSSDRNGTFERRDALIPIGWVLTTAAVYDPAIFSTRHLPDEQAYGVQVRRCASQALAGHYFRGRISLGASHAAFIDGIVADANTKLNGNVYAFDSTVSLLSSLVPAQR